MRQVNPKVKSKKLEVMLLDLVAEQDLETVSVSCNSNTLLRLQEYSKATDTIPELWNNEKHTFLGLPVVVSEKVLNNMLIVNPPGRGIFWAGV